MSPVYRATGLAGVLALLISAQTFGQSPPQAKAATPASQPATADSILGSVRGEPIRRSEVVHLLSGFVIPTGSEERAYKSAMDTLVHMKLLGQFLKQQRISVSPAEIDKELAEFEKASKENNSTLEADLKARGDSLQEFRELISRQLQFTKYVKARATDAELQKYFDANKDLFNNTQVRASHILVKIPADATEADKQKALQKIRSIKQEIEAKKISFADAANKYSDDDGNKTTPSGGDLDYFPRRGRYIEPFTKHAFALKKGEISEPVETDHGYHLIHLTDRREGEAVDFEKIKPVVLDTYAAELQESIYTAQRKEAEAKGEIKIEPLPPGLIQPASAPEPAASPAPANTPKPAAAKAETPKS